MNPNVRHYPTRSPVHMSTPLKDMFHRAELPVPNETSPSNWDDIHGLDQSIASGLFEMAASIAESTVKLEKSELLTPDEVKEMDILVRTSIKDVETFTDEILSIRNTYQGKKGPAVSKEDEDSCLDTFQNYMTLNDRSKAVLFNPVIALTELMSECNGRMSARDVNVVTDVVVKESQNG